MGCRAAIFGLGIVFVTPTAGGAWGTLEQAVQLYQGRQSDFEEIYEIVVSNPALKQVSSGFDPARSTEFIPKYAEFTEATKEAYRTILLKLESMNVELLRVSRFKGLHGGDMELVGFVVFSRGIGGSSEGIEVVHVKGDEPPEEFYSPMSICVGIEQSEWYVCHFR